MRDVFVSIRGRVAINVEALNMTESVGNYVKHRRVPVTLKEDDGSYSVYFVPAISGESLAHALQAILAEECNEANSRGRVVLPVCGLCSKGIFLKSSNKQILSEAIPASSKGNKDIEELVIKNCVVEDVGGFLYAEQANVKRTSNFYTGYMIPTREALKSAITEPQLHSRYALGTKFVERGTQGQMIYYVELASTIYTFGLDIDTRYIGKITFNVEKAGTPVVSDAERAARATTFMDAVRKLLVENSFGAKKTRFLPTIDWESMVISVSDRPWTVPTSFTRSYIERAQKKTEKISYNTEIYPFEGGSFETYVYEAVDRIKQRIAS
jgi:CRISPR-associated protein Csa2